MFLAIAVAACGDSSGPGGGPVALLTSPYVDYDTADGGSEASNLEFTLKSFGYTVTQVNGIDSTTVASVLATSRTFVIPEAGGSMWIDMTAGARTVLERWVDSSGGLLVVTADDAGINMVDSLFGHTITGGPDSTVTVFNSANAAGTPFAGGQGLLFDNDGTYHFDATTLPTGGKAIYINHSGGASVGYLPQGRGVIVFIGWDWYQAMPKGGQDNGWLDVLRRALRS